MSDLPKTRVLVLWNQVDDDIYEEWQKAGPRPLPWNPAERASEVDTVDDEVQALIAAITEGGYETTLVNIENDFRRLLAALDLYQPDVVFNMVEFFNDDAVQEAYVAGVFELLGIPYTGCDPVCLATCQDKYRTKLLLRAAGLPTAQFFLVDVDRAVPSDHGLRFPLIVKPSRQDASSGIEHSSVVVDKDELEQQVARLIDDYDDTVLVEEYIDGREIHAAILGHDPPLVLPLFEMEFDDSEFREDQGWRPKIISYSAKWDPHTKDFYSMEARVPPKNLDPALADRLRQVAAKAFTVLGCRGYARIDMRVGRTGQPCILEVNPNPDLVEETAYMMCAQASGRTFSQTLAEIIEMARARGRELHGEEIVAPQTEKTYEYMPSMDPDSQTDPALPEVSAGDKVTAPSAAPKSSAEDGE